MAEPLESKTDFPKLEEEVLAFWRLERIFEKSLEARQAGERYTFYDGPPFATGTPHYGHILASAIKDAVPRYQTMRGKYVARRWGWDCHGLPIENIVEKALKLSGRKQIDAYGIDKFNHYARSKVLEYVGEWKKTVERMARWVDFDGSYKTMDNTYIESVWWALGELHKQGRLYEGTRVLPYCPRCETPVAQSEIAMDASYKEIRDLAVTVKLELVDEPGTYLLVWTTTPWTLPGNTAAAVREDLTYAKVNYQGARYIAAKQLAPKLFPDGYQTVAEFSGAELVGKAYQPIFSYFVDRDFPHKENAWKVYPAPYVSDEEGTGIVHLAPAFGEEDMELAKAHQIPSVWHVDREGKFASEVTDFAGQMVKPKDDHQSTDVEIIKLLDKEGKLFKKETIVHPYPHCFRCETPLIYYALPAWFIRIQDLKPRLAELNEKINWIPAHLKHGRFLKSLEAAPDWNISRNRYWASPLPLWKCPACSKLRVVGGVVEFKDQLTNRNTFYFLRHGKSEHHAASILDSQLPGKPLTEAGRQELKIAAKHIKDKGITKIIASPFVRTKETAEIVAAEAGLEIEIDDRLREMDFGDFHGYSIEEWRESVKQPGARWTKGAPNGENWHQVQNRMIEAISEFNSRYRGETILVVSHGDPLYTLFLKLAGVTTEVDLVSTVPYPRQSEVRQVAVDLFDLHRPYIDEILFPCACGGTMERIPEVFDCWFESGSMPFAANHYPFENQAWFKANFPADVVAEYIAQTRTWFYYMHVLATSLFDSIPFKNVVTTGTILAENGEKMSKSRQNFPDPWLIFNRYGVDALRFHLLSSSLLKAEDMNFSEREVDEVFKKHILRLQNVLAFYQLYPVKNRALSQPKLTHVLDRWLLARLVAVTNQVTTAMDDYEIDQALRPIAAFVDDLSVWYLRRSRQRLKEGTSDSQLAAQTLRYVLMQFAKVIAPFIPFSAEIIYRAVRDETDPISVHLEDWPTFPKEWQDKKLLADMAQVRTLVELGHADRNRLGIKLRQPLARATVTGAKALDPALAEILLNELNVKQVEFSPGKVLAVTVDPTISAELREEGLRRDLARQIQTLRKQAGLVIGEPATVGWWSQDPDLTNILKKTEFTQQFPTTNFIQLDQEPNQGFQVSLDGKRLVLRVQ